MRHGSPHLFAVGEDDGEVVSGCKDNNHAEDTDQEGLQERHVD